MHLYGIKFREKGQKEYKTLIIPAVDVPDMYQKLFAWEANSWYDIDRRTISWSGDSVPLSCRLEPILIYANLDDLT